MTQIAREDNNKRTEYIRRRLSKVVMTGRCLGTEEEEVH